MHRYKVFAVDKEQFFMEVREPVILDLLCTQMAEFETPSGPNEDPRIRIGDKAGAMQHCAAFAALMGEAVRKDPGQLCQESDYFLQEYDTVAGLLRCALIRGAEVLVVQIN